MSNPNVTAYAKEVVLVPPQSADWSKRTTVADIMWLEPFASSAINRMYYGMLSGGVSRGCTVEPDGTSLKVIVAKDQTKVHKCTVEVDNQYLIGVRLIKPTTLTVPKGVRQVVIVTANYQIGQVTDQVSTDSKIPSSQVLILPDTASNRAKGCVLCDILVPTSATKVEPSHISYNYRIQQEILIKQMMTDGKTLVNDKDRVADAKSVFDLDGRVKANAVEIGKLVPKTTRLLAGYGISISDTGALSKNVTISSKKASVTAEGAVVLSNAVNQPNGQTKAATEKAVYTAWKRGDDANKNAETRALKSTTTVGKNGITITGKNLGSPLEVVGVNATTTSVGVTTLSDSTTGSLSTKAATEKAVGLTMAKATSALNEAKAKVPKVGDSEIVGTLTIKKNAQSLILKSTGAGVAANTYLEVRDNGNVRQGYVGCSSASNNNFTMQSAVGHLDLVAAKGDVNIVPQTAGKVVKMTRPRSSTPTQETNDASLTTYKHVKTLDAQNVKLGTTQKITGRKTLSQAVTLEGALAARNTASSTIVMLPKGGQLNRGSAATTGFCKIKFPAASFTKNHMVKIRVNVFEYVTGKSFDLVVAGYMYHTNKTWLSQSAYIVADPNCTFDANVANLIPKIHFCRSNTEYYIAFGDAKKKWNYPNITITEVQTSGAISEVESGWAISYVTSIPAGDIKQTNTLSIVGKHQKAAPAGNEDLTNKKYVDAQIKTRAEEIHKHANIKVKTDSTITVNTKNEGNLGGDITLAIKSATTTQRGAVQLSTSTTSGSTTAAATSSAVKAVKVIADKKLDGNEVRAEIRKLAMYSAGNLGTQNLDSVTNTGMYTQTSNANATSSRKYPIALAGVLEVIDMKNHATNKWIKQVYTGYSSNRSFFRLRNGSSWTAWSEYIGTADATAKLPVSRVTGAVPELTKKDGKQYARKWLSNKFQWVEVAATGGTVKSVCGVPPNKVTGDVPLTAAKVGALTKTQANGLYGQLNSSNTFNSNNTFNVGTATFNGLVRINHKGSTISIGDGFHYDGGELR